MPSTNDSPYSLKNSLGKFVVLYFYPKDDTPGCTMETNDFNNLLPKFKKLNCEVLGISKNTIKSHKKFKEKYRIKFDLLSDKEIKVINVIKFALKKFMGRDFMGAVRSTFLINPKCKIIKIWNNFKVKGHAQNVLNTLKFHD